MASTDDQMPLTTDSLDSLDSLDSMDGVCPWVPDFLPFKDKELWLHGLKFESQFFDQDREPATITPQELPWNLRLARARTIFLLMAKLDIEKKFVHQSVLAVDRLLMTKPEVHTKDIAEVVAEVFITRAIFYLPYEQEIQCAFADKVYKTIGISSPSFGLSTLLKRSAFVSRLLGDYAGKHLHSTRDWLQRFIILIPVNRWPDLTRVHSLAEMVAVDGSLAHHRPSMVAAAIVLLIMGDEGEQYLWGYDAIDVSTPLEVIRRMYHRGTPILAPLCVNCLEQVDRL